MFRRRRSQACTNTSAWIRLGSVSSPGPLRRAAQLLPGRGRDVHTSSGAWRLARNSHGQPCPAGERVPPKSASRQVDDPTRRADDVPPAGMSATASLHSGSCPRYRACQVCGLVGRGRPPGAAAGLTADDDIRAGQPPALGRERMDREEPAWRYDHRAGLPMIPIASSGSSRCRSPSCWPSTGMPATGTASWWRPSIWTLRLEGELWRAEPVTLRWVLRHLTEETARHNGPLDILRNSPTAPPRNIAARAERAMP